MREGLSDDAIEVEGHLCWNEFEGGFWSLELDPEHETLGSNVVLGSEFTVPAGAADGARLRVRLVHRPDVVDFLMAGPRADVLDAELLA